MDGRVNCKSCNVEMVVSSGLGWQEIRYFCSNCEQKLLFKFWEELKIKESNLEKLNG